MNSTPETLGALSGDLTGKEVWHITAPATIPLTLIKEFDLAAVDSGCPILTHKKRDYGFQTGVIDFDHLLLPRPNGSSYGFSKTAVCKSCRLQEIATLSQVENEQSPRRVGYFATEQPSSKPAVQQPETLKMRFRPFGAAHDTVPSTNASENPDSENFDFPSRSPLSPPSTERTPKKKKRKQSNRSEKSLPGGQVDDPLEIDDALPLTTSTPQSLSHNDLPRAKIKRDGTDADGKGVKLERKKRKKQA